MHGYHDEHHRLLPGVLPGWGMSWWWHDQALTPADTAAMSPSQRLAMVIRYWREVADGWVPSAPKSNWAGPHDPFSHQEIHPLWHPPLRV